MSGEPVNKSHFKKAKLVDYTCSINGFKHLTGFGKEFIDLVRECNDGSKSVVIIDRGLSGRDNTTVIVRDHINLTGDNPLTGPNHPAGERFPVVQGIYYSQGIPDCSPGITAGLKAGALPNKEELEALRTIGVDNCSYNLVPSMLVAAHAGWKVLGILLAPGQKLDDKQLRAIHELVETN